MKRLQKVLMWLLIIIGSLGLLMGEGVSSLMLLIGGGMIYLTPKTLNKEVVIAFAIIMALVNMYDGALLDLIVWSLVAWSVWK